jgi:hypothetical protein
MIKFFSAFLAVHAVHAFDWDWRQILDSRAGGESQAFLTRSKWDVTAAHPLYRFGIEGLSWGKISVLFHRQSRI